LQVVSSVGLQTRCDDASHRVRIIAKRVVLTRLTVTQCARHQRRCPTQLNGICRRQLSSNERDFSGGVEKALRIGATIRAGCRLADQPGREQKGSFTEKSYRVIRA